MNFCWVEMALSKTWIAEISTNPWLVTRAVEDGICHMGYERIKRSRSFLRLATQSSTVALARFVLQAGTEELLCSFRTSSFLEHSKRSFYFAALSMLPRPDKTSNPLHLGSRLRPDKTSEHSLAGKSSTTVLSWRYNSVGPPPFCIPSRNR